MNSWNFYFFTASLYYRFFFFFFRVYCNTRSLGNSKGICYRWATTRWHWFCYTVPELKRDGATYVALINLTYVLTNNISSQRDRQMEVCRMPVIFKIKWNSCVVIKHKIEWTCLCLNMPWKWIARLLKIKRNNM